MIERLRLELNSWTSIELRVRKDQEVRLGKGSRLDKDLYVRIDFHYIEEASGRRLFDEQMTTASGSVSRQSAYCDGGRCANVTYETSNSSKEKRVDIINYFHTEKTFGMKAMPQPLVYYYLAKEPIYEAIRRAEPLGEARVLGRNCSRYLFRGVRVTQGKQDLVYSLDNATSTPLRVESYRLDSQREPDDLFWSWEASSLDRVEGDHWFPLHSVTQNFAKGRETFRATITVEEIHYDRAFAATTFWPKSEPGVEVNDTINKTFTVVPGPSPKPAAPVATTGQVAKPPRSWTPIASGVTMGLGLTILLAALWIKRRR